MPKPVPKIAVVVPKYGLVGGGEKFVAEVTERIAGCGRYEMHVLANRWRRRSNHVVFHKVPIITFPKFMTTVSFAWFVEQRLKRADFGLVHSHERVFDADVCTLHSVPHCFWVSEIRKKRRSLFDITTMWVERQLIKNGHCRRYLPVSSITEERFLQKFNVDPDKVTVLHPGVDCDRFESFDRNRCRSSVRKRFGLAESDIVLLFAGMNFELKGLDALMASMAAVKAGSPGRELKLLVVGKGNEGKYRRIAADLGIGEDVRFTGLWEKDIEEVYLASDMFSMLSRFDTFGMTALEAMAASLPVIISKNVGAKDLVRQGRNGFVVDRSDIDTIGKKIGIMLDDGRRTSMAEEARKTARDNSWDALAQKIMNIYDELLDGDRCS